MLKSIWTKYNDNYNHIQLKFVNQSTYKFIGGTTSIDFECRENLGTLNNTHVDEVEPNNVINDNGGCDSNMMNDTPQTTDKKEEMDVELPISSRLNKNSYKQVCTICLRSLNKRKVPYLVRSFKNVLEQQLHRQLNEGYFCFNCYNNLIRKKKENEVHSEIDSIELRHNNNEFRYWVRRMCFKLPSACKMLQYWEVFKIFRQWFPLKFDLIGELPSPRTIKRFILEESILDDIETFHLIKSDMNLGYSADITTKGRYKIMIQYIYLTNGEKRMVPAAWVPDKKATSQLTLGFECLAKHYLQLADLLGVNRTEVFDLMKYLTTSVTDAGSDNVALIDLINTNKLNSNQKAIVWVHCCVHKESLLSKRIFGLFGSVEQQRLQKTIKYCVLEFYGNAESIEYMRTKFNVQYKFTRCSDTRFVSHDAKATQIFIIRKAIIEYCEYRKQLYLIKKIPEKPRYDIILTGLSDERLVSYLWLISRKYLNFDIEYLSIIKKHKNTLEMAQAVAKIADDMREMSSENYFTRLPDEYRGFEKELQLESNYWTADFKEMIKRAYNEIFNFTNSFRENHSRIGYTTANALESAASVFGSYQRSSVNIGFQLLSAQVKLSKNRSRKSVSTDHPINDQLFSIMKKHARVLDSLSTRKQMREFACVRINQDEKLIEKRMIQVQKNEQKEVVRYQTRLIEDFDELSDLTLSDLKVQGQKRRIPVSKIRKEELLEQIELFDYMETARVGGLNFILLEGDYIRSESFVLAWFDTEWASQKKKSLGGHLMLQLCVKLENNVSRTFNTNIQRDHIDAQLTNIHGITTLSVHDSPDIKKVIRDLDSLFASCGDRVIIMLSHSCNDCDHMILHDAYEEAGEMVPRNLVFVNTMRYLKIITFNKLKHYDLKGLFSVFEGETFDHHSADGDTMALYRIVMYYTSEYLKIQYDEVTPVMILSLMVKLMPDVMQRMMMDS